jgi:hypothetical protein
VLSARAWQRIHGVSALLWLILCVPGILWWKYSVPFVVFASLWANVATHISSWQGARAERKADPDDPA